MQLDLDDEQASAGNAATVRAFWEQAAPELGLDARFVDEAVSRAGGNLQRAAMLRKHVEGLPPAQRRVEGIPRGLAALLASAWERTDADPAVVDGLGVLCAAHEALTLDELGAVAGWTSDGDGIAVLLAELNRRAMRGLDLDSPLPARLHTRRCALRAIGLVFQPRGFGIIG